MLSASGVGIKELTYKTNKSPALTPGDSAGGLACQPSSQA